MSLPWKRMYVDIPGETKEKLVKRAAELGMSQKALVAQLIEQECVPLKKPATKSPKGRTKRAKKKSKRSRR